MFIFLILLCFIFYTIYTNGYDYLYLRIPYFHFVCSSRRVLIDFDIYEARNLSPLFIDVSRLCFCFLGNCICIHSRLCWCLFCCSFNLVTTYNFGKREQQKINNSQNNFILIFVTYKLQFIINIFSNFYYIISLPTQPSMLLKIGKIIFISI